VHIVRVVHFTSWNDMTPNTASTFGALPETGYVRQAQLIPAPIPFSSATLWRKVKAGHFPAPVKLSERVTAWRVEEVRAWLNAQSSK
jgi:prophage regulatory protein